MSEQSENQTFLTALARVHEAFPHASPSDLVENFQKQIEGHPSPPLGKIGKADLPALIRHIPELDKLFEGSHTSQDLVTAAARKLLPPDDFSAFLQKYRL